MEPVIDRLARHRLRRASREPADRSEVPWTARLALHTPASSEELVAFEGSPRGPGNSSSPHHLSVDDTRRRRSRAVIRLRAPREFALSSTWPQLPEGFRSPSPSGDLSEQPLSREEARSCSEEPDELSTSCAPLRGALARLRAVSRLRRASRRGAARTGHPPVSPTSSTGHTRQLRRARSLRGCCVMAREWRQESNIILLSEE